MLTIKKNFKFIIFVIVILFIYLLIAFLFKSDKSDTTFLSSKKYLVLNNDIFWEKNDKGWKDLSDISVFNNVKFNIYDTNKNSFSGYINAFGNAIYVKDKKSSDFSKKKILGAVSKGKLSFGSYEIVSTSVLNDVYSIQVLKDVSSDLWKSFNVSKVTFDFDGDGTYEFLYVLSDVSINNTNSIGTFVFVVKEEKIYNVLKSGVFKYEIKQIVDVDGDGASEIIFSKQKKISNTEYDSCYEMYGFNANKVNKLKECNVD